MGRLPRALIVGVAVLAFGPAAFAASPKRRPIPLGAPDRRSARSEAKPSEVVGSAECRGIGLEPSGRPPFKVGEELTYDLSIAGMYVGRMEVKVGKPRSVGGRNALALFARARTSGFTSTFKSFLGRYMVLSDAQSFHPIVVRSESKYGEDPRTEHARFSAAKNVSAQYLQQGKSGERAYERQAPLYDILTLLYYARLLPLKAGMSICQEVYADKRLWRMEAEVTGVESVMTAAGNKDALAVKTRWVRMPHPDFDPKREAPKVEVDIYFSTEPHRVPLTFTARAKEGTAKGDLVRWSTTEGEGELSWEF
jgi:hypothetical protein